MKSFLKRIPYKLKGFIIAIVLFLIFMTISDYFNLQEYKEFYRSPINDTIMRVHSDGKTVSHYTPKDIEINSTVLPGGHIELKVGDSISKVKNSTKFKVYIKGANGKYTYRNTSNYIR